MANRPSINNVQRALRVYRDLDAKVLKQFRTSENMSIKDAYILALMFATKDTVLTAEDHEKIADEKRKAKAKMKGLR